MNSEKENQQPDLFDEIVSSEENIEDFLKCYQWLKAQLEEISRCDETALYPIEHVPNKN